MKKKIRILKNDDMIDHGTFLNDMDYYSPSQTANYVENNSINQSSVGESNDKYKKKKVMNKNNATNSGLKYTNPSQRNHSSIYE